MLKLLLLISLIFGALVSVKGQTRYFTKTGHIYFFSKAPLEDIEAHNRQVVSFIDLSNAQLVFSVPMTGFKFKKSLMQEHFNENYVESHKYPKASFKGKVLNMPNIDLGQDRKYKVIVEGLLTIHGVERALKTEATLEVKGKQLFGNASFSITPQEFDIEIPFLVRDHIAKRIDITVNMLYQPYTGNNTL
ncbi:YceI family protein [Rufibacter roseus]|uniref:YceI family protein n=1 Tax=Rufibacter roseus TaxID=1567108 RepID=A0ABW2DRJ9_9BACT|nr:YceI family protein [Rufibacter roseus]